MKYKSKTDWWFHLCVLVTALFTAYIFYLAAKGEPTMLLAAIMFAAMFFLFLLPTYLFTYYVFEEKQLVIRSGLTKRKIPYTDIISCNPGTATGENAALSRERLVIAYMRSGKKKTINVSPKEGFDFQTELKLKLKKEEE